jgi:hypothetical protein
VIRPGPRFGASPVFIPVGEPQFHGGVGHFNGWFQEPLLQRRFHRPGDPRRELGILGGVPGQVLVDLQSPLALVPGPELYLCVG